MAGGTLILTGVFGRLGLGVPPARQPSQRVLDLLSELQKSGEMHHSFQIKTSPAQDKTPRVRGSIQITYLGGKKYAISRRYLKVDGALYAPT